MSFPTPLREHTVMEQVIEYIIVGGPEHGLICRAPLPSVPPQAIAISSNDGQLCRVAARRHSDDMAMRMLLLHPHATGEQFRTMLAA